MSEERTNYRRRDDGVLEMVRPSRRKDEALRGFEVALTVVALAVAFAAAMTHNLVLGGVLFVAATALTAARLVRDRMAARAARAAPSKGPNAAGEERVALRVIRLEEHAPQDAPVPGTGAAVRLPGTAASPRE